LEHEGLAIVVAVGTLHANRVPVSDRNQNKQARFTGRDRGERNRARTTPTLTLSGDWSARKASVTPRMGSLAAGSMWPNSDDICLAGCRLASWGRRLKEDTVRDNAAMPGEGRCTEEQRRGGGREETNVSGVGESCGLCSVTAPLVLHSLSLLVTFCYVRLFYLKYYLYYVKI
jgi:hypothetical protein